jgi:hypothetical protein
LCFVVLGVTGTEGQETKRFLGARKPARLLVGREDSIVSLWESGKIMLGSAQDYITMRIFDKPRRRYFRWYFVIDIFIYFCFKF